MLKRVKLNRFIPFRKKDILEKCLILESNNKDQIHQFFHLLSHTFHFEFYKLSESLKDSYADCDPDRDTRVVDTLHKESNDSFVKMLSQLLDKANYEKISQQAINQSMHEASLFKIRLHVDFDDFSEVILFCRGESVQKETVPTWFGLYSKEIEFVRYERVVVYLKLADKYTVNTALLMPSNKPNSTLLKLFQNVPKADLEMLFPNTQVRMRLSDKLFIGIPALISGGIVLSTKLGASLVILASLFSYWFGARQDAVEINQAELMILIAGLGAIGAYIWKQYSNFKNRKLRFLQSLTQNLYFKNLDNNAGVFHRLINDEKEEEVKEAFLAYYFLYKENKAIKLGDLDKKIEVWFLTQFGCELNFEVDDAVNKLKALQLIRFEGELISAVPLADALKILDQKWDGIFKY